MSAPELPPLPPQGTVARLREVHRRAKAARLAGVNGPIAQREAARLDKRKRRRCAAVFRVDGARWQVRCALDVDHEGAHTPPP